MRSIFSFPDNSAVSNALEIEWLIHSKRPNICAMIHWSGSAPSQVMSCFCSKSLTDVKSGVGTKNNTSSDPKIITTSISDATDGLLSFELLVAIVIAPQTSK